MSTTETSSAKRELFSEEAIERVFSPENLDSYLRVVRPSALLAVLALVLFVVGVAIWGFLGTLPLTLDSKGLITENDSVVCYVPVENMPSSPLLDCKAQLLTTDGVTLEGVVTNVSAHPLSQTEIVAEQPEALDAWTTAVLATSPYSYRVTLKIDDNLAQSLDILVDVTIVVRAENPIKFLLN